MMGIFTMKQKFSSVQYTRNFVINCNLNKDLYNKISDSFKL